VDELTPSSMRMTRTARRPLRILLSAYACEPDRGSEPGIGWQWATRLARAGHEVVVMTRANNAKAITDALADAHIPSLHFVFYDLPAWARFWKRGGHGVHLYYFLWQCFCWRLARRLHDEWRFDVVHHLTFGVFRQPSWLSLLGAPFIFGPVGGGEHAPRALRRGLPIGARARECLRDVANAYARIDPLLRMTLKRAAAILCKTQETCDRMPRMRRDRCRLFLEVGTEPGDRADTTRRFGNATRRGIRVLYVGRLVYLKGLHLALPAFARLLREAPDSRFTIVGSGPQETELRALADRLAIADRIDWLAWLPHETVLAVYPRYDVFLFPSLHDSSGNAVIEAMTAGLPVVCLNLGGPAAIVDSFSGIRVSATAPDQAVEYLGDALSLLADNSALRLFLARGAHARATRYFAWPAQIERMTALYYTLRQPEASAL
jgi:glycosyltransferase involved in cell wall biosynthesis